MENIKFLSGTEDRFKEFISNIVEKDRVALISHTDHDGIASAKVVSHVLNYQLMKFVNYEDINDSLVEELQNEKITKVVFTDLSIEDASCLGNLSEFADILIIDHHLFDEDINSDKIVFMNAQGYCAAYLSYYLFSKIKDIEELDWLVACASIADWQHFNNAKFMNRIFEKHGEEFNVDKIKEGRFWDIQANISLATIYFHEDLQKVFDGIGKEFGDLNGLEKYADEVQKDVDKAVETFQKEKETYGDVYLYEVKTNFPVKSIVSNVLSRIEENKTYLLLFRDNGHYHISARRQDKKLNLPDFLENLLKDFENADSGGHIPAAGGHFLAKDLEKLKKRLEETK